MVTKTYTVVYLGTEQKSGDVGLESESLKEGPGETTHCR